MTVRGSIPENLTIFSRAAEDFNMDEMWGQGWRRSNAHTVKARKAFAVNRDSSNYKKTAERWANAVQALVPRARSRISALFELDEDVYEECVNDPIKNIRIFTLEFRGEGGRAYKVVTEDGYCYDFREDILVEAMIESGIKKGGILNGEYVWATVGSQMKLIRVGSHLYNELKKRTKAKAKKKISTKDYTPGTVYETAAGQRWVFCGFCHTRGNKKKRQLWIEVRGRLKEREGDNAAQKTMEDLTYYNFEIKTSCAVVTEIGTVDLGGDIFERCRTMNAGHAIEWYEQALANHNQRRQNYSRWGSQPAPVFQEKSYFEKYTVTPFGDPIITSPLVERYER